MSETRNVYEFQWRVRGDSQNRGTASTGITRILATHFDDAWVMFRAGLKRDYPNKDTNYKDGLNFEVTKAEMVLYGVTV